jgi:hypothetical protein
MTTDMNGKTKLAFGMTKKRRKECCFSCLRPSHLTQIRSQLAALNSKKDLPSLPSQQDDEDTTYSVTYLDHHEEEENIVDIWEVVSTASIVFGVSTRSET